jgi:hypothetical protein
MKNKFTIRAIINFLAALLILHSSVVYSQDCNVLLENAKKMIREASCNKTDPNKFATIFSECVQKLSIKQCNDGVAALLKYIDELAANPKLIDCGNKPPLCKTLAEYRDNKLLKLYNEALSPLEISQNHLQLISKIKKELLDDTRWATSDLGRSVAVLSQYLKLQCNLLENIIETVVPASRIKKIATKLTYKGLVAVIQKGGDLSGILSGEVDDLALDMVLEKFGPVGSAIGIVKTLAEDVNTIKVNEDEFRILRKEISTKIEKIGTEIKKYNSQIIVESKNFNNLKSIKNIIDLYLTDNCTSATSR